MPPSQLSPPIAAATALATRGPRPLSGGGCPPPAPPPVPSGSSSIRQRPPPCQPAQVCQPIQRGAGARHRRAAGCGAEHEPPLGRYPWPSPRGADGPEGWALYGRRPMSITPKRPRDRGGCVPNDKTSIPREVLRRLTEKIEKGAAASGVHSSRPPNEREGDDGPSPCQHPDDPATRPAGRGASDRTRGGMAARRGRRLEPPPAWEPALRAPCQRIAPAFPGEVPTCPSEPDPLSAEPAAPLS